MVAEAASATVLERKDAPHAPDRDGNQRRSYTYRLRIQPVARGAFEVDLETVFWLLELKPAEGDCGVGVRIDDAGQVVAFDLAGDPRYDADALIARTAAARRLGG